MAMTTGGGGTGHSAPLHGGDEQADEDGDDRDHHQQLDQRDPPPLPAQSFIEALVDLLTGMRLNFMA
jgi:hypothetical protein